MNKLLAWLYVEPTGFTWWSFLAKITAINFFITLLLGTILDAAGAPLRDETTILSMLQKTPLVFLFFFLPLSAAFEETLFRLPLALFIQMNIPPMYLLVVAALLSVIFGYAHGGWWQVPLQGVGGFIFCLVFLKCGGLEEKFGKAFFSSSCAHLLLNWIASIFMFWGL